MSFGDVVFQENRTGVITEIEELERYFHSKLIPYLTLFGVSNEICEDILLSLLSEKCEIDTAGVVYPDVKYIFRLSEGEYRYQLTVSI
jgi:hypothetical protein